MQKGHIYGACAGGACRGRNQGVCETGVGRDRAHEACVGGVNKRCLPEAWVEGKGVCSALYATGGEGDRLKQMTVDSFHNFP